MNNRRAVLLVKFGKGITFSHLGLKTYQHFKDGYSTQIDKVYYHHLNIMVQEKVVEIKSNRYYLIEK